jgi:hypothetical protein
MVRAADRGTLSSHPIALYDLIAAAERPWCEQEALVFEN